MENEISNMENWFKVRSLRNLDYQVKAINDVKSSMIDSDVTVLAAAPSAGKTLMSIYIIDEYLERNPTHKVLVLAHGTTVLRTQYYNEIVKYETGFTSKEVIGWENYDERIQVNVCLPQTLNNKPIPKIDLLVVDEAHEFYFPQKTGDKNMMKHIIENSKPSRQLLLTGTPAKFILNDYPIIPVTLNTLFDANMVTDLLIEVATSSYNFDNDDYNPYDELYKTTKFNTKDTDKTLDELLTKVVKHINGVKGNSVVNFTNWLPTLKQMKKTMFACKSQEQAKQVQKYFKIKGINSALSISDTDNDSSEIQRFIDEDDCIVLIVVGRGILGFNMKELHNVIDMTMSRNINRIYQLMCRVVRPNGGGKKLFLKVAPNTQSDYFKYIMTAVMSLSEEEFYLKFNGKNFNDMEIPIVKTSNKRTGKGGGTKGGGTTKIRPIMFEGLPAFSFFKDIFHKKDALLHTYTYTNIRTVRAEFYNTTIPNYWTDDMLIEDAKNYNTPIEWRNGSSGYQAAYKRGRNFYDKCCVHMTIRKAAKTKEECIEISSTCKTKKEWKEKDNGGYQTAYKNGWIDECCSHMIKQKPNGYCQIKENVLEDAKNYDTPSKWSNDSSGTYQSARINGWFDEATTHMIKQRPKGYWDVKENIIEDAKPFNTPIEWKKKSSVAYSKSFKNGWYDEATAHMIKQKQRGYWNVKENVLEDAKNYDTPSKWQRGCVAAYRSSRKHGWYDEAIAHMIKNNVRDLKSMTKEEIIEIGKGFKTITEWISNDASTYRFAHNIGWFDEATKHMKITRRKPWILEEIFNILPKYSSYREFIKNERSAYNTSIKKGWLDIIKKYFDDDLESLSI